MDNPFDNYKIDDEIEEKGGGHITMWQALPYLMTMPTKGWEMIKRHGPTPEIATLRFLLPICLLAGGAEFFSLLYPNQLTFTSTLVNAVVELCSFFLGYFMALVLAKLFLPGDAKFFPSSDYGKLLTMAGVATLAFFHILLMALPMFDFLIEFLPLWTIFITYKGMNFAEIDKERSAFSMGVMCVVIICSPVLIEWIFSLFS